MKSFSSGRMREATGFSDPETLWDLVFVKTHTSVEHSSSVAHQCASLISQIRLLCLID
jgi:hypothetical protein